MAEELLQAALRVLSCYSVKLTGKPDPKDIALLRAAANDGEVDLAPDILAVDIIRRELRRKRGKLG
jgi:hypothetical protein